MTTLKLPIGKQVLFMFGTLCTILGLTGAFLFLSLGSQAVIFRHLLATNPIEIELVIAPQCTPSR